MNTPQPPLQEQPNQGGMFSLAWVTFFSNLAKFLRKPERFPLSFAANWSDYGGVWQTGSYFIDSSGVVHLSGLIQRAGVAVGGEIIGVLPIDFRPAYDEGFAVTGNWADAAIYIDPSGVIRYLSGSTNYLSLSGVSFMAK